MFCELHIITPEHQHGMKLLNVCSSHILDLRKIWFLVPSRKTQLRSHSYSDQKIPELIHHGIKSGISGTWPGVGGLPIINTFNREKTSIFGTYERITK